MKKYLKILPLILYPYAYLIFFAFVPALRQLTGESPSKLAVLSVQIAVVGYNLGVLILALWSAIGGLKRYYPRRSRENEPRRKMLADSRLYFSFSYGHDGIGHERLGNRIHRLCHYH